MLQLVGLIVVLAIVYAVKAFVVMRKYDDLAQQSTAFSWTAPREEDVAQAETWTREEQPAAVRTHAHFGGLRPAGGASA